MKSPTMHWPAAISLVFFTLASVSIVGQMAIPASGSRVRFMSLNKGRGIRTTEPCRDETSYESWVA